MAGKEKKAGGGKLSRSQVITVRLDPRLRHGAEIASRKQRRTVSSFVEWAVEQALAQVKLEVVDKFDARQSRDCSAAEALDEVWDIDAADRFVKLAIQLPDLLNHDEQIIWKRVRECGLFWYGEWQDYGGKEIYRWEETVNDFAFETFRQYWDLYKLLPEDETVVDRLPKFEKPASI